MAAVTLLSAVSVDTDGTGQAMSGPCTVQIDGDSGGGRVLIEASIDNVSANFKSVGRDGNLSKGEGGLLHVQLMGAYYIRARLVGATATASLTVRANN